MPHYVFNLWKDIPFTELSSTAKRLMVAHWMNQGKMPRDIPHLTRSDRSRVLKICDEEGQEVLQDVLMTLAELERENRLLRRQVRDLQRGFGTGGG